jgi:hypothetical protein
MPEQLQPEMLDTLVCEIGRRPAAAPSIEEVVPAIRSAHRQADALIVTFDAAAAETVRAVVDAERLCCSSITWALTQVSPDCPVELQIGASPNQLDVLEAIFTPPYPAP